MDYFSDGQSGNGHPRSSPADSVNERGLSLVCRQEAESDRHKGPALGSGEILSEYARERERI